MGTTDPRSEVTMSTNNPFASQDLTRLADLSTCLDAAMCYAGMGWAVIPLHGVRAGACTCGRPDCGSEGKHPRTLNGVKDATTEPEAVGAWWRKWPDANVGIATGAASGLLVVDVDERHDGYASLSDIPADFQLPVTLEVRTGGGGSHYYYSCKTPSGCRTRVLTGIDIRGDGGYVVAPPSLHLAGGLYAWVTDR